MEVFNHPESTIDDLQTCDIELIPKLYSFSSPNSIIQGRYEKFIVSAVHGSAEVMLSQLPPTPEALLEHVKRTYLQVQSWLGKTLSPEEWGWKRTNTMLLPVQTTKNPAPDELIKMVSFSVLYFSLSYLQRNR